MKKEKEGSIRARKIRAGIFQALGFILTVILYLIPAAFVILTSFKSDLESMRLQLSLPEVWHWENYPTVIKHQNYAVLTGLKNSALLAFFAIILIVLSCSLGGYILQRRKGKLTNIVNVLILAGLMIPPAIVPTIWVLNGLGIYKTIFGMVLVETALMTPFATILYRGYVGSVPKEIEEAALVDGCKSIQMFVRVVFPLLKPVTSTIITLDVVTIFNDFTNPLYFLPGAKNFTAQLTLYNFTGQFASSYNLLYADVVIILMVPLILYIFFNKQIVAGMTSGAVKG
jgi:raffinose/stachyose/melibiose transport system permease protein